MRGGKVEGRFKILDLGKKRRHCEEHLKNFGILKSPSCDVAISVGRMRDEGERMKDEGWKGRR
jgi:hypothetical protein